MIANYAWVALGSALGGMARYAAAIAIARMAGEAFPWGTLLINVLGSLVIGWFASLRGMPDEARLFVMTGLCGGFTTFSAFSLQTFDLLRAGEGLRAGAYVLASVLLCLAATALGWYLGRS
jgi:CrcB protein